MKGRILASLWLSYRGLVYAVRILRYALFPQRCDRCRGWMSVYFLRSEESMGAGNDDIPTTDWLACKICGRLRRLS